MLAGLSAWTRLLAGLVPFAQQHDLMPLLYINEHRYVHELHTELPFNLRPKSEILGQVQA
jgi:hypothetical protein